MYEYAPYVDVYMSMMNLKITVTKMYVITVNLLRKARVAKMSNCTDCEEYNQEKHYCPKFCDVIRNTTKEMQEFYKGEHEKLEKIEQIVKQVESLHLEIAIGDREGIRKIKEVLEQE